MKRYRIICATFAIAALAACGDDDDGGEPPVSDAEGEITSYCDENGHRVYVTDDDYQATSDVFVVPDDCR